MNDFKTSLAIMLLVFGLLLYFTATDPFIGKTELNGEKIVFDYTLSKIDPIIHKIFVDIKAEREIEAILIDEMYPEGKEVFEYKGDEIHFVKTARRGEVWTLTLYNKNPAPVKVEYDARITCYSYVYVGIILTAAGFFILIWEKMKKRNQGQMT